MSEVWNYYAAVGDLNQYRHDLIQRAMAIKTRLKEKRPAFPGWLVARRVFQRSGIFEKYQAVAKARQEMSRAQTIQRYLNFYMYLKVKDLSDTKRRLDEARIKRDKRKGKSSDFSDPGFQRLKKPDEPHCLPMLERKFADLKDDAVALRTRAERSKYDLTLFQTGWAEAIELNLV